MRWRRNDDRKRTSSSETTEPVEPAPREPADGVDARDDLRDDEAAADGEPSLDVDRFGEERAAAGPPDVPVDVAVIDEVDLARARRRAVARALAEDLGDRGDVTSLATIPPGTTGSAQLVARADGVVCGLDLVLEAFDQVDTRVQVTLHAADGDRVRRGDVLGDVAGPLRSILTAERTALNFLTHLSGIATRTRQLVDAVAGTGCHVRDTRKTIPGLRLLEKHAVRVGGGHNHRIGLHDALLIKDNHHAAAGSVTASVEAALARAGDLHVQVEVASLEELEEALAAGAMDVLLDNFTPEKIRQAIRRVDGRASLEASGNITLETVRSYAETGVHRVAVGSITHSAPALDIALDVTTEEAESPAWAGAAVWGEGDAQVSSASEIEGQADEVDDEDAAGPPADAPSDADEPDAVSAIETAAEESLAAAGSEVESEPEAEVEPEDAVDGSAVPEAAVESGDNDEPDGADAAEPGAGPEVTADPVDEVSQPDVTLDDGETPSDRDDEVADGAADVDEAVEADGEVIALETDPADEILAEADAAVAEDPADLDAIDLDDEDEPAGLFAWRERQVRAQRGDD